MTSQDFWACRAEPLVVGLRTKTFGAVVAVNDLSFEAKAGEFLTLLGPSGAPVHGLVQRPGDGRVPVRRQVTVLPTLFLSQWSNGRLEEAAVAALMMTRVVLAVVVLVRRLVQGNVRTTTVA